MAIFYSRNRFSLFPPGRPGPVFRNDISSPRESLNQFLQRFPEDAFPHLRCIELVFPSLDPDVDASDDGAHKWEEVLLFFARKVNLSKLTLVLNVTESSKSLGYPVLGGGGWSVSEEQQKLIHFRLVKPLTKIPRPKNFFVFVLRDYHATLMEAEVMGQDYDALAHGKYERPYYNRWDGGRYLQRPVYVPDGSKIWPDYSSFTTSPTEIFPTIAPETELYQEPYASKEKLL